MNSGFFRVSGIGRVWGFRGGCLLFCPLYFSLHSFSSANFVPLFHCHISILLIPCPGVFWKHSCMSSPFSIAILNGTCSLRAPILLCGEVPAIKQLFIIIIKKCRQCKAERERCTPYQSEDPSPIIPTYSQKVEKGKKSGRLL